MGLSFDASLERLAPASCAVLQLVGTSQCRIQPGVSIFARCDVGLHAYHHMHGLHLHKIESGDPRKCGTRGQCVQMNRGVQSSGICTSTTNRMSSPRQILSRG